MNNFSGNNMRNRRNLLDLKGFAPIHFPLFNYSTDAQTKTEMKNTFEDGLLINNLHLLSDPLKKNLADSVITGEEKTKAMPETKEYIYKEAKKPPNQRDFYPSLAGITNFISGVFNVMGTIFQKRASSPETQYYDCFENNYDDRQMAPDYWQPSNIEVQNKNEQANTLFGRNESHTNLEVDMSIDCRNAANHCEEKLNQVRLLLTQKGHQNVQNSKCNKYTRRPRKAFIEAGSVDESFEDAFSPEDFVSLANDTFIEYFSPYNCHDDLLIESDAPRVKTESHIIHEPQIESMEVKNLTEKNNKEKDIEQSLSSLTINDEKLTKDQLISSCEDKLNKLKSLLQSKRCKSKDTENTDTQPIQIPSQKVEKIFGNEISSSDLQSNSQHSDSFNEVTGKFGSSVDSEDSFQIVFTDSPQNFRRRIPSECESEDSFIVFEESPDSCYISNDVFENNESDSGSDESDVEDSGCDTCKLSPSLFKTFGDLTDDSLYSEVNGSDVVDSVCEVSNFVVTEKTGLLIDERRKIERKKLPAKKVHFSTDPPKVHVMRVWAFAARQARAGHWERHALDRERFKRRIADVEMAISWVLKPQHRSRVVFQRFMPWWNAQKRKELAEKKEREEREKQEREKQEKIKEENNCQQNGEFETEKVQIDNIASEKSLNMDQSNNRSNDSKTIDDNNDEIEDNDKSLIADDLLIKNVCLDT